MGPVALGYGLAALLACIVAWCGPSQAAKGFGLALFASWGASNFIYLHAPDVFVTAYGFAWLDTLTGGAVAISFIIKPRIWNGLLGRPRCSAWPPILPSTG